MKEIANELPGAEKKNNFSVPDGYFDEFPLRMQEKIHQQRERYVFSLTDLFRKPAYVVAFAAVLLLLISIPLSLSIVNRQQMNQQIAYHEIEMAELDYFDISEEMLIEALSANGEIAIEIIDETDQEIMDYVLDNVDYSTILDEF